MTDARKPGFFRENPPFRRSQSHFPQEILVPRGLFPPSVSIGREAYILMK
jgi:hypothetical protein